MPPFGPVHVLEPRAPHTHTIIFLHGRGSTGKECAEELLEAKLSNGKTLQEHLPSWRWVFPSSPELWSTAFQEAMPAWFEAYSLTDPTARQDLQMLGIRESVGHLARLLGDEIERLGGAAGRVVLAGISQGAAVGMWTLLCAGAAERRLGGFVGASAWLPFAGNLEGWLGRKDKGGQATLADDAREDGEGDAFVEAMATSAGGVLHGQPGLLSVPVFLGHGTDDAYVDIELGRQAADVLGKVGLKIEWREYTGADQEGHWLKEPEEFDDIVRFLESVSDSIKMY